MVLPSYSPKLIANYAKRSAETIATLHPSTQAKVKAWLLEANRQGFLILVYSGYRDFAEQWALRKAYLEGGARAARPGESFHNYRAAIDFVPITPDGKADWNSLHYEMLGKLGEKHGLYWGGRFGDKPHLQDNAVGDVHDLKKQVTGWEKYHAMEEELLKKKGKPSDYDFVTYEIPVYHKRKKKKLLYIGGTLLLISGLVYVYRRKRRSVRR